MRVAHKSMFLGAFALSLLLVPPPAFAQIVDLIYDDGQPGGQIVLAPGDIEATRMTPEHPARLLGISLYFGAVTSDATIYVWADNGGNAADLDRVLWTGVVTPVDGGWTDIDLAAEGITLDPPAHFHVGHIVGDPGTSLAWDTTGNPDTRSFARLDGDWFFIGDGADPPQPLDALVRATVEYFNIPATYWFTDITDESGVAGMSRVAWGDYDDDQDDDLLVNGNRLFRNNGDGTFTEVSEEAGIAGAPTNGGVWADYNNDGTLDFYATVHNFLPLCNDNSDCTASGYSCAPDGRCKLDSNAGPRAHDILYRNNGDGTFTDVSEEAGRPYDYLPTEGAAWGDMDADGFVDLYVANYETPQSWTGGMLSIGTLDYLWQNNGDGTFTDVSEESGIRGLPEQCGRGVNWVDYDDDGWQDIFVSNYRLDFNFLWHNLGLGIFENSSGDAGVAGVQIQGAWGHTIGSQWADVDNDLDWDLFTANLAHPRFIEFSDKSMMYINQGPPDYTFVDTREQAGITFSETHSDPAFGDFDNDGNLDLFITDVYTGYQSFLYQGTGGGNFADVTYPSGIRIDNGWGCAWADIDNDGDLDFISRRLYLNELDTGNWIKVRLIGETANRAAIGAKVSIAAGGVTMMRQVEGGKGTTTQSSLTLHFGLGSATVVDELVIDWPTRPPLSESFTNVEPLRTVTYIEGRGEQMPDAGVGDDAGTDTGGGGGCAQAGDAGSMPLTLFVLLFVLGVIRRRR